ncbi:MAG: hypothetical protein ABI452_03675 [Candidatus Limnocylindrales bacterium]
MSPIDDDDLISHLARRSASRLTVVERQALLEDVVRDRGVRRTWTFRPALLVAPIAAAVILAVLLYPLLLTLGSPPIASPSGPSATTSPTPSTVPGTPPTAAASPELPLEPTVYTAQQLSDMIGDPAWIGRVVLADAQISHMMAPPPLRCQHPIDSCQVAFLAYVTGKNVVDIGWRDTSPDEGQRYDDGSGPRWLKTVGWDEEPGIKAFKIEADAAQYLGPVVTNGSDLVWPVTRVPVGGADEASDDLYPVDGWLLETIIASCRAPIDYGPDTSTEYWCGGSFLQGSATSAPQTSHVFDPGGLHVQRGAYQDFAPDPAANHGQGTDPRHGIFLVRQIGCQPAIMGGCPVWRMVGRLA